MIEQVVLFGRHEAAQAFSWVLEGWEALLDLEVSGRWTAEELRLFRRARGQLARLAGQPVGRVFRVLKQVKDGLFQDEFQDGVLELSAKRRPVGEAVAGFADRAGLDAVPEVYFHATYVDAGITYVDWAPGGVETPLGLLVDRLARKAVDYGQRSARAARDLLAEIEQPVPAGAGPRHGGQRRRSRDRRHSRSPSLYAELG